MSLNRISLTFSALGGGSWVQLPKSPLVAPLARTVSNIFSRVPKSHKINSLCFFIHQTVTEITSADRETPLAPQSYTSGSSSSSSGNSESDNKLSSTSDGQAADLALHKERLKNSLREACLPKLLCEMAAKPNYSLNVRERDLLSLIR